MASGLAAQTPATEPALEAPTVDAPTAQDPAEVPMPTAGESVTDSEVTDSALDEPSTGLDLPQVSAADALTAARAFADAKLLAEEGYLAKALDAYEQALELDGRDPYAHMEMAQFLVYMSQVSRGERRRGQHLEDAIGHAELARQLAPNNADVLLQFAQIHLRLVEQNRYESIPLATEAFESLMEQEGREDDLQVLTSLGQLYLWQRDGVKAAEVLREAADLRPNFPTVQLMLVEALLGSDQKREAETVLEKLLELTPQETEHRLRLAELRSERGDHRGAVAALRHESLDMDGNPRLRQALARELHLSGDNAAALQMADTLLAEMPNEPGLHRLRVAIFSSLGRYREAVDELRPLIDLESDDVARRGQDLRLLSRLLERLGEPLMAADALERQLAEPSLDEREQLRLKMSLMALWERHDMSGKSVDLLEREMGSAAERDDTAQYLAFGRLLSDLYQRLDQGEMAQAVLDQLASSLTEDQVNERQTLQLHRLPGLLADQQWSEAETLASSLEASENAEIRLGARLLRAQALAHLDRLPEALALLQPEDDAEPPLLRRLRADRLELLFEHGEEAQGRQELDALVASGQVEDLYFTAQFYQSQSLYSDAVQWVDKVLEQRPESVQALFLRGAALERSGDSEASAESFLRLLDLDPDHAPTLNYLGYMWVEQEQRLDEALRFIQRAVSFEPDNGAYVDSLGWALFKLERFDEARIHLEWAARLLPEDPTIFEHLGDLYLQLDEPELAAKAYQDAVELGGDEVQRVIDKLEALTKASAENDS